MNTRVHIRHTGDSKFRFGVSRGYYRKPHWNIFFGRLFLAIRDKRSDPPNYKSKFIDLGFGRGQLKNRVLRESMTKEESYRYHNCNPEHIRLEYFLKMIRSNNV